MTESEVEQHIQDVVNAKKYLLPLLWLMDVFHTLTPLPM
jgi:hypothetical protein